MGWGREWVENCVTSFMDAPWVWMWLTKYKWRHPKSFSSKEILISLVNNHRIGSSFIGSKIVGLSATWCLKTIMTPARFIRYSQNRNVHGYNELTVIKKNIIPLAWFSIFYQWHFMLITYKTLGNHGYNEQKKEIWTTYFQDFLKFNFKNSVF